MRIWLVTVGEPLPLDEGHQRLHRTGILAKYLVKQGHEVVWWTSSFNHTLKVQRADPANGAAANGCRIILLRAPGYRRNVSLARMLNHYLIAKEFRERARQEPRPDIILASLPTLELPFEAVKFGRAERIPVVVDVRDLWPDVILDLFPSWAKFIGRAAVSPLEYLARSSCRDATAVTAASPNLLDWGVRKREKPAERFDQWFPLAYEENGATPEEEASATAWWASHGISRSEAPFIACFVGAISRQFEFSPVFEATKILRAEGRKIKLVICGVGDRLDAVKKGAAELGDDAFFAGWVQSHQILTLMRLSSVGLAPYCASTNFSGHIPNKIIEYMSAGLPVVTTLADSIRSLSPDDPSGLSYGMGDAAGLAAALRRCMDDRDALQRYARSASRLFQERFRASKVYPEIVSYLQQIVSSYSG